MKPTTEEKYCVREFEKWWKKEQKRAINSTLQVFYNIEDNAEEYSKYLAEKAWKRAWFQSKKLTGSNEYEDFFFEVGKT